MPHTFGKCCLLMLGALCAACTFQIASEPAADITPAYDQLPVTMGVYYSDEFLQYEYQHTAGYTFVFPVGKASRDRLDKSFRAMFRDVVPVESISSNGAIANIDAIVAPRIVSARYSYPSVRGPAFVRIRYRFSLYDARGRLLGAWGSRGVGTGRGLWIHDAASDAFKGALRAATSGFVVGFEKQEVVKEWLERTVGQSPVPGAAS